MLRAVYKRYENPPTVKFSYSYGPSSLFLDSLSPTCGRRSCSVCFSQGKVLAQQEPSQSRAARYGVPIDIAVACQPMVCALHCEAPSLKSDSRILSATVSWLLMPLYILKERELTAPFWWARYCWLHSCHVFSAPVCCLFSLLVYRKTLSLQFQDFFPPPSSAPGEI